MISRGGAPCPWLDANKRQQGPVALAFAVKEAKASSATAVSLVHLHSAEAAATAPHLSGNQSHVRAFARPHSVPPVERFAR